MRTTSRALQVFVILTGAPFLFLTITHKEYLATSVVIAIVVLFCSILGFSGIDPTLKKPAAHKYFRVAATIGMLVIGGVLVSLVIALFNGELHQALRMLAVLSLMVSPLWKYRREIPDWLRK